MSKITANPEILDFNQNQVNSIVLATSKKFVDSDISLLTKVTKAVLTTSSTDVDHKQFSIQIPNGNSSPILLVFTTGTDGNTIVTGSNVS